MRRWLRWIAKHIVVADVSCKTWIHHAHHAGLQRIHSFLPAGLRHSIGQCAGKAECFFNLLPKLHTKLLRRNTHAITCGLDGVLNFTIGDVLHDFLKQFSARQDQLAQFARGNHRHRHRPD